MEQQVGRVEVHEAEHEATFEELKELYGGGETERESVVLR